MLTFSLINFILYNTKHLIFPKAVKIKE